MPLVDGRDPPRITRRCQQQSGLPRARNNRTRRVVRPAPSWKIPGCSAPGGIAVPFSVPVPSNHHAADDSTDAIKLRSHERRSVVDSLTARLGRGGVRRRAVGGFPSSDASLRGAPRISVHWGTGKSRASGPWGGRSSRSAPVNVFAPNARVAVEQQTPKKTVGPPDIEPNHPSGSPDPVPTRCRGPRLRTRWSDRVGRCVAPSAPGRGSPRPHPGRSRAW